MLSNLIFRHAPDATAVVFRASDDGLTAVVEGAAKYFVIMAFEHLQAIPGASIPHASSAVLARC